MYIRKVNKKNSNHDKVYSYYRLVHGYKVGNKVRQQTLLNLGKLEELPVEKHKLLADRIEMLLTGTESLLGIDDELIESLAQKFTKEIQRKGIFNLHPTQKEIAKPLKKEFHNIDLTSLENIESKDIGGEWLCKQVFDRLDLKDILLDAGFNKHESNLAQLLLTSKLLHPSSESETTRWLKENSGAINLYDEEEYKISRYKLYKAASLLFENKRLIEDKIYTQCKDLFSSRNKFVIYDLTNTFFEGRKLESAKAHFGRSKEKRYDCRLISLALAIDSNGFIRHNQIYPGNISETSTLDSMLDNVKTVFNDGDNPVIVMDAGISSEENLTKIKKLDYDYVCVSLKHPKNYEIISKKPVRITDNRGKKITIETIFSPEMRDYCLHVSSQNKKIKEESIDRKLTQRFEERLQYLKDGLTLPRRLKKIVSVYEAIGRIKNQFSKVSKLYKIECKENKEQGLISDIQWFRQKEKEKPKGEYFIRYSQDKIDEKTVWDIYNLTREVEASFRCLKSDLNIRPIHHQKDIYTEQHIWLGIIAYQIVNYIRLILKEKDIHYSWTTIVNKMKTQKTSTVGMNTKDNKKIYAKLCTRPIGDVEKIYKALSFKDRPYTRKLKVVTQM